MITPIAANIIPYIRKTYWVIGCLGIVPKIDNSPPLHEINSPFSFFLWFERFCMKFC